MFRALNRFSTKIYEPCYRFYETHTVVLNNGLRVAVEETSSPLACVSMFVQTGPRFETPENNGISHFIEHIMCMGLQSMESKTVESCLNNIGGRITATTTREYQSFTGIVPAEHTLALINIISLMLTTVDIRSDNIEKEKENMLLELQDRERSPKRIVFDYLHQAAFQDTPLAKNVMGPVENICTFEEVDVNSFFNQQYRPENQVLAVSGAVQQIEVISQAQKKLTHTACGSRCLSGYDLCRYTGSSIVYRDDSMPFAHVAVAIEVPGYEDPDFWPLYVANCISGDWHRSQAGGEGNGAYIAQAAASLACECYEPFYIMYQDIGLWGVYYVSERVDVSDLVYNIQCQWMSFCHNVTEPELQRGINYAKFKLSKEVDNPISSCRDIGLQMLYTCSRMSLQDKLQRVQSVTLSSINAVGHKYIYDKCPVMAAIGPTECATDYGRLRAGMYWLRY